ncbi:PREDICTED: uncharacterized protein LOC109218406 [Nicotiana attenuata]|uniref:Uncharacterized protein n=1 Tax=Nicotiana attenuata TaxID=49451 RepID=A0A1J6JVP1_NICAT|nr:PREDICTED: uncharacterized protein LOC109218406 [Nicotiana attenuata]OIT21813.1 hypothetical protein A4A49_34808 [Nicotiana attenuata]
MANFRCSIEMEPKTLNQGQLNLAREVAVDIVQNTESDEASNIFVEGRKAVIEIKKALMLIEEAHLVENCKEEQVTKTNVVIEASCQCSCPSAIIDSPDQSKLKEPLSAPF